MTTPRRIVCTTFGSLGDLHPYLALGRALVERGHQATIATAASYQSHVEAAGLRFAAIRPDPAGDLEQAGTMDRLFDPIQGPELLIRSLIMPYLRQTYDDLTAVCADADILVTNAITFAAQLVQEKLGMSWVSVALSPMTFLSAHDPPVIPVAPSLNQARSLGPAVNGVLFDMMRRTTRSWVEPWYSLRAELGLSTTRANPIFEGQFSERLNLAAFSPALALPQPDWPKNTVQTGFLYYDRSTEAALDPGLERFLDAGEPPIVFTLGSAAVLHAGSFYQMSVDAARALGRRALLLVGPDPRNRPADLPDGIAAFEYAPYSQVFPRAAAIVHQGGIGTTAQALRAGRPMLVVPFGFDQPDNAARCVRIGVGRTIPRREYRAENAAAELSALLGDPACAQRAAEIGRRVASDNGAGHAADAVLDLLSG